MARYIKANPEVAEYLHLENDRNRVKDGNYLLWQADMLAFGRLTELPETLEKIGGIALSAHEARQEQDGTVCRELPTATDSRFAARKTEAAEEPATTGQKPEESTDAGDGTGAATEPTAENAAETGNVNEEKEDRP